MADEFTWEQSDDAFVIRGPQARISMARIGGRWTHRLELDEEKFTALGASPVLISAVEVEPEHSDPARIVSPVYQELQRHNFAGDQLRGVCLLLTGHLFQHHFSVAVSAFRDPAD